MGYMFQPMPALIKESDHEATIMVVDLTEKDEAARIFFAIDGETGEFGWFSQGEIRHKIPSDVARIQGRKKEIADLKKAYESPAHGDKPKGTQPGMIQGKDCVTSGGQERDIPPEARQIIEQLTNRFDGNGPRGMVVVMGGPVPMPPDGESPEEPAPPPAPTPSAKPRRKRRRRPGPRGS